MPERCNTTRRSMTTLPSGHLITAERRHDWAPKRNAETTDYAQEPSQVVQCFPKTLSPPTLLPTSLYWKILRNIDFSCILRIQKFTKLRYCTYIVMVSEHLKGARSSAVMQISPRKMRTSDLPILQNWRPSSPLDSSIFAQGHRGCRGRVVLLEVHFSIYLSP